MPYRRIPFLAGYIYHVYNRGAGQNVIFRSRDDYIYFTELLIKYSRILQITILAYCLMPNHFHLLLRQENNQTISRYMRIVTARYAVWFNSRYERSGTLFEGRFKAIHVDTESYLRTLCAYIHLNPVKARLSAHAAGWPYSNAAEWLNSDTIQEPLDNFIRDLFGSRTAYAETIEAMSTEVYQMPDDAVRYTLE